MEWIILIGIWLIAFFLIYLGIRTGTFRKRIESLKEAINDFKKENWTAKIIMILILGIFIVGYLAFRFWIG